jgi:hypothetical protein
MTIFINRFNPSGIITALLIFFLLIASGQQILTIDKFGNLLF